MSSTEDTRRGRGGPVLRRPFRACDELDGVPHVMVDGASRPESVLTLSHWPGSPTPPSLARDLSTESCFAFLALLDARPRARGWTSRRRLLTAAASAEAVTCDHFDEDGALGVFALSDPETALAAERLVTAAARCGDFGVVDFEEAAMVAFSLLPLASAEVGADAGSAALLEAALLRLPELLASPSSHSRYFGEELAAFRAGVAALRDGSVSLIEEDDLVVVTRVAGGGRLPGARGGLPLHEAAVHSAAEASRVLAFDGDRCELYFRYEGWVRLVSRRVSPRCDLAPLAAELSVLEPGEAVWEASGPASLVPRLSPSIEGRTELEPRLIRERVMSYLAAAPAAFDPLAGGALS